MHFFLWPQNDASASIAGCYLHVADVDALWGDWSKLNLPETGIPRLLPVADRAWGMRQFWLVDIDGNLLSCGQSLPMRP